MREVSRTHPTQSKALGYDEHNTNAVKLADLGQRGGAEQYEYWTP